MYVEPEIQLHGDRAIAVVEPWSLRTWLAVGGAAVLVPLALTFPATGALDLLLVGVAAASAGGVGWAIRIRRWLDGLPLEIAPVVGTGIVDGVRVWRFRARLGRGRLVEDPRAEVSFVGSDGVATPLEVEVPRGRLCGPFTIIARDVGNRFGASGAFRVSVSARSSGTEWRADRQIPAEQVREGRFGGIAPGPGPIRFEGDWTSVEASA